MIAWGVIVDADSLEALEDFFDNGAPPEVAAKLLARFGRQVSRTYDGPRYSWAVYEIFDPASADVTAAAFRLRAERRVVVAPTPTWVAITDPRKLFDTADPEDYVEVDDELAEFWAHPVPLYHATPSENVDDILEVGLEPRSDSRGLRNRGIAEAVFTTLDREKAESGLYGDAVFAIDTKAMAAAGYTPQVTSEPDVVEAAAAATFAWALGLEIDVESENDPDTAIVHGPIPPEFLRLLP